MTSTNQLRLLSFTLDDWTALGGQVSVSLLDHVAVLVGRNGAGKSAILEGFEAISSRAIGRFRRSQQFDSDSIPKRLDVEILTPTERRLGYRYEVRLQPNSTDNLDIDDSDDSRSENSEEIQYSWNEYCQYIDGNKELLWTTEAGVTTLNNNGDKSVAILGDTNSLRPHLPDNSQVKLLKEMQWVYTLLSGIHILGNGYPIRQKTRRSPCFLRISGNRISYYNSGLVDNLARKIFRSKETGELDELESVCQRIGLGNSITIQKFILSEELGEKTEEYLSSVLLDGVNIGLLSDGTLRVLSILVDIITLGSNVATIIIEEPEMQIHPGMLAKLLNELETYTFKGNLILSTHSPQVVAWTSPEKINLVYRNHGRTTVQKLHAEEIMKVVEYLSEEGDLGEWLYSGILDE